MYCKSATWTSQHQYQTLDWEVRRYTLELGVVNRPHNIGRESVTRTRSHTS
eukprot:m.12057 g.12057  ORF g.12057 m.12057 type:complete len:51 (+) comp9376_c0_seq2:175-327(+)